jgi:hypothetical protein
MPTCSGTQILSFPLNPTLAFTPQPALYGNYRQAVPFEITWSTLTTAPVLDATSYTWNETSAANTTTLRYNGQRYTFKQGQLTKPKHSNWLSIPTTETSPSAYLAKNTFDLQLTFVADSTSTTDKYVILSMPLIDDSSSIACAERDPKYLVGLLDANMQTTSISLKDFFPDLEANFLYYSVCVSTTTASTDQLKVFVCTDGLLVSHETYTRLTAIAPDYDTTFIPRLTQNQPNPIGDKDSFGKTTETIMGQFTFSTNTLLTPATSSATTTTTTSINSFKCVPLDPNKSIKDGQITIDTSTGVPLSQEEVRRRIEPLGSVQTDPKLKERQKGFVFGIQIFFIVFFSLVILFVLLAFFLPKGTRFRIPWENPNVKLFVIGSVIAVLFFILGIVIQNFYVLLVRPA